MRTRRWFSDLESCSAEHANWRGAMPGGGSADFRLLSVADIAGIGCGKEIVGELGG